MNAGGERKRLRTKPAYVIFYKNLKKFAKMRETCDNTCYTEDVRNDGGETL